MSMRDEDLLIRTPENEFKLLLERDTVVADIKEKLHRWINVIHEMSSYGSNLIPRCYSSSAKNLKDAVVLAILLRQVVAMLDGVDILLVNGATHVSNLPMRALFEASAYIDWVLLQDSEKKADYYYVHNLRRKRLWAARAQGDSAQSQKFLDMMATVGVPINDELRDASKQHIQEIDRILAQPQFAAINKDFDNLRRGSRDVAWYVPLGPKNLAALAQAVNKQAIYTFLYSTASEVMHASSYDQHIKIGKGEITFHPIRSMEGMRTIFYFTLTLAVGTFRTILLEYRAEEISGGSFARKYAEKWRKDFLSFPKIEVRAELKHF
jgi:hypothetical protein